MRVFCALVHSSIGKKLLVAAAGLLLCGFLVVHLGGNLLIFSDETAFNKYAEALHGNPLLPLAEIGLLGLFLLHIVSSLVLRVQNAQARPIAYVQERTKGARTPGSRTMTYSALIVLAFLIVHIKTFRFGDDSGGPFRMVMTAFQNQAYAGFYVVAMIFLGLHLSHGFQSGFQTLGFNHPKYTPWIKWGGLAFSLVIAAGFAAIPLWAGFLQQSLRCH